VQNVFITLTEKQVTLQQFERLLLVSMAIKLIQLQIAPWHGADNHFYEWWNTDTKRLMANTKLTNISQGHTVQSYCPLGHNRPLSDYHPPCYQCYQVQTNLANLAIMFNTIMTECLAKYSYCTVTYLVFDIHTETNMQQAIWRVVKAE